MSDMSDNVKYKWTPESTALLVSVWTDRQVQKQLEYATKPQLIWESIAKYMRRKGYEVTAKQCRSRMKQVLVCYKEAKKTGTRAGVERYYESIDKVLETKRSEKADSNDNGIDTVDSVPVVIKSPPKDIKTNVNLRMRHSELQEPPISLNRHIEVVPGTWQLDREEYGDSSESNETVLVRPHRSLSPMRNVGTSTMTEPMRLGRTVRRSLPTEERFRYENIENNRFSEIPLKNSVQNVQNQIIQENMMLRNQLAHDNIGMHQPTDYPINIHNPGPRPTFLPQNLPQNILYHPNRITTNMVRMQSQLQQYSLGRNTGAMPQEPRKSGNLGGISPTNVNYRTFPRSYADAYPPDIAPNLNDAFCQGTKNTKVHNLNETYDQQMFDNEIPGTIDATTVTNNATFNDDTISIEFIDDSPSPTENGGVGMKSEQYDNRTAIPDVPVRKKKAQKLEQLMLNAITSQTEVVSKILAAQDSMVTRILDLDQDRQNRLENRLDQLMNVVQATVLNKSNECKESEAPQQPLAVPLCFSPPPRPGTIPPKLDLVPPKPCRVPCTSPIPNIELVNQQPIQTRPGVIGPNKPGTIWTKLGPVSQSPFVKAQQQISAATKAAEHWRTKSSAERRIARSYDPLRDPRTLIDESRKFIEAEKLMEARIENARRLSSPERDGTARRKLFDVKEPAKDVKTPENKQVSAAIIMTKAFLDIERQAEEKSRYSSYKFDTDTSDSDELLGGQGESYDRLRRLSVRVKPKQIEQLNNNRGNNQLDTSTPAKPPRLGIYGPTRDDDEPRQTIQQLAELVMNSARWRNVAADAAINREMTNNLQPYNGNELIPARPARESDAQRQSRNKAREWLQDQYAYGKQGGFNDALNGGKNYPIGFTTANLNIRDQDGRMQTNNREMGFTTDFMQNYGNPSDDLRNKARHQQQQRDLNDRYGQNGRNQRRSGPGGDDEEDDEFLDTTTTLQPRKESLTSTGGSIGSKPGSQCVIS